MIRQIAELNTVVIWEIEAYCEEMKNRTLFSLMISLMRKSAAINAFGATPRLYRIW